MTKTEATNEWIENIDSGKYDSAIVVDTDGQYFVNRSGIAYAGEMVVYSYGGHVNSDANMDVEDLIKRF
jgi:hypothetical protein